MVSLNVRPLQDDLSFGVRISGVTKDMLKDVEIRRQINEIFEDRGMIVFEDVEPTNEMQLALSNVFGPLKEHPVALVPRVDHDAMPGVIDMRSDPGAGNIIELNGKQLTHWLPWHFDHCYNDELNLAGILRAVTIPPEGGMTGFADGVELYNAISPELRAKIERLNVIYTLDLRYDHMRFGLDETFRVIDVPPGHHETSDLAKTWPRAIHPAVWTRASGEKVLHVSPWMASGIEGHEDAEGDALLEAVCQEIAAKVHPYFHKWKPTDMLIWDNIRMLHAVSGHDPKYPRRMQRTTIKGDYGLGYFEKKGVGDKVLEPTA